MIALGHVTLIILVIVPGCIEQARYQRGDTCPIHDVRLVALIGIRILAEKNGADSPHIYLKRQKIRFINKRRNSLWILP